LNLRAYVVEKSCFVGHERLCGGAEPPFSSIAVLVQPLANSVVKFCLLNRTPCGQRSRAQIEMNAYLERKPGQRNLAPAASRV
jgi:hypothetical protein